MAQLISVVVILQPSKRQRPVSRDNYGARLLGANQIVGVIGGVIVGPYCNAGWSLAQGTAVPNWPVLASTKIQLLSVVNTLKKKSTSERLCWCFRLQQIEDSIQYLEGPNSTWKD